MLSLPFKIATYSLKYFGVNISRDPKDIYKLNFLPMLENLKKSNINYWRTLRLSLMNAIKMVILPRFLYLF